MEEKQRETDLSTRKQDHIELAFKADIGRQGPDPRFHYEPMLAGNPDEANLSLNFLGKKLNAPMWVSSMTGGTEKAREINHRLATSCAKYKLGMGLGSCRPLLESQARLVDFDIRDILGNDLPFFANLGIAQIEQLLTNRQTDRIDELVQLLKADGLIVHVNPLQEWLQPEGDKITQPPIDTIQQLLTEVSFPVIVKEVGQGMGPASIKALLALPIAAFELAAHGGTNFSKLELLRSDATSRDRYDALTQVGHSASEMVDMISALSKEQSNIRCKEFILSGGIKDFLDGYYLVHRLPFPAVYGMASQFLRYAKESQDALDEYIATQLRGLQLAHTYLRVTPA